MVVSFSLLRLMSTPTTAAAATKLNYKYLEEQTRQGVVATLG
jgi:hypothetical protein